MEGHGRRVDGSTRYRSGSQGVVDPDPPKPGRTTSNAPLSARRNTPGGQDDRHDTRSSRPIRELPHFPPPRSGSHHCFGGVLFLYSAPFGPPGRHSLSCSGRWRAVVRGTGPTLAFVQRTVAAIVLVSVDAGRSWRRPCRRGGSVLRELRALGARCDLSYAMPPRRVAGDERSEPPVAPGRGCDGCAVGVVVSSLRAWWVVFVAASLPPGGRGGRSRGAFVALRRKSLR